MFLLVEQSGEQLQAGEKKMGRLDVCQSTHDTGGKITTGE